MASPTPTLNQVPNEPSLADLLDLLKKEILLGLCSHHIGTIQSFNATNQTATVSINYKKTFFVQDVSSGLYDPVLKDYPLLIDCPVVVLGGSNAALTFPISQGDECLMLFNDRDIDNWFQGAGGAQVATSRLHSFSDAIALIGVNSLPNVLTAYDTVRAVLRNGQAMVGVSETLIKIANNTTTLNTLLQSLVSEIKMLVTATAAITVTPGSLAGPSSLPLNAAAITAIGTALTTLGTQIGGLLE